MKSLSTLQMLTNSCCADANEEKATKLHYRDIRKTAYFIYQWCDLFLNTRIAPEFNHLKFYHAMGHLNNFWIIKIMNIKSVNAKHLKNIFRGLLFFFFLIGIFAYDFIFLLD